MFYLKPSCEFTECQALHTFSYNQNHLQAGLVITVCTFSEVYMHLRRDKKNISSASHEYFFQFYSKCSRKRWRIDVLHLFHTKAVQMIDLVFEETVWPKVIAL